MTYSLARNSQVQTAKFDPRGGNRRGGKREGPSSQFSEGRTCRRGEILPQYFLSMNTDDVKKAYAKLPGRIIKGPPHRRKAPYSGDPKDFILDFGKHAGTALKDTPVSYLIWMVENITNKPDLIELVKRYLSNGGLTSMKGLRSKVVSIAGLSTKRSPLTPSPAKQAQGEKGGTSPAPVPARSALQFGHFETAKPGEILDFSPGKSFLFFCWPRNFVRCSDVRKWSHYMFRAVL